MAKYCLSRDIPEKRSSWCLEKEREVVQRAGTQAKHKASPVVIKGGTRGLAVTGLCQLDDALCLAAAVPEQEHLLFFGKCRRAALHLQFHLAPHQPASEHGTRTCSRRGSLESGQGHLVSMRMSALWGDRTALQMSSWVTGMAILLEMHRSDR